MKKACAIIVTRYSPNHKCQAKFFLLIASDDVAPNDLVPPNLVPMLFEDSTATLSDDHFSAQLSLHAMVGHSTFTSLRVNSYINGT